MSKDSAHSSAPAGSVITGENLKRSVNHTKTLEQGLVTLPNFIQSAPDRDLKHPAEEYEKAESFEDAFGAYPTMAAKEESYEEHFQKNDASAKFLDVITDRLKNM